ncbi:hypothetical protein AHAS_Ahas09G0284700 [Arachis hypogaea]
MGDYMGMEGATKGKGVCLEDVSQQITHQRQKSQNIWRTRRFYLLFQKTRSRTPCFKELHQLHRFG